MRCEQLFFIKIPLELSFRIDIMELTLEPSTTQLGLSRRHVPQRDAVILFGITSRLGLRIRRDNRRFRGV